MRNRFRTLIFLLRDPVPMVSGRAAAQSLGAACVDERAVGNDRGMFHARHAFQQEFDTSTRANNAACCLMCAAKPSMNRAISLRPKPWRIAAAALSVYGWRDERASGACCESP
jgi:hypothetical protein